MPSDRPTVVVVAGGQGTRVKKILGNVPKFLAPVGEKPFGMFILEALAAQGVARTHLLLGHQADTIVSRVPVSLRGMDVTWTAEERPRGVLGSIIDAIDQLPPRFVVVYGDVYPPAPADRLLKGFWAHGRRTDLVMSALRRRDAAPHRPNMLVRDGRLLRYSKTDQVSNMTHLEAGMFAVSAAALLPPTDTMQMEGEFFQQCADSDVAAVVEVPGPTVQVGDAQGYAEACRILSGDHA